MCPTTDNDDDMIGRMIDDLTGIQEFKPSRPSKIDEDTTYYQILDQAPNGRKLMNYMTYSPTNLNVYKHNKSPAKKKVLIINREWLDEEKRANTQTTPASLQLETPVIFSWSKKAHDNRRDQVAKSSNDSVVRESINNRLYKKVATSLDDIKSKENWNSEYSRPSTVSSNNGTSSERSGWANPNFKVDPLQPFVAKIIKEPKKKESKKEKSPSKMKNLLNFLSASSKKERSRSPDVKSTVAHNSSSDESQEIEASIDEQSSQEQDQSQEQGQEQGHVDDKIPEQEQEQEQEQASPSPTVTLENTSEPPNLPSAQTFNADSPLSMSSFIPLQPKKKN